MVEGRVPQVNKFEWVYSDHMGDRQKDRHD